MWKPNPTQIATSSISIWDLPQPQPPDHGKLKYERENLRFVLPQYSNLETVKYVFRIIKVSKQKSLGGHPRITQL